MVSIMNLSKLLIIVSALFTFGCSENVLAEFDLKKELASGVAVVLIINANEDANSEQYADWSHYLNQFSIKVGNKYIFHKVSSKGLNKLIVSQKEFYEEYSMIFIKKGQPTYFNQGAILEPQVYEFVKLSYAGKPIEPKYLEQFSPKKLNIKVKD